MGEALNEAQLGGKHPKARPLKGFHGSGVVEIADDYDGNTYRAIYTVRWSDAVYVLHAFQKKSKRGIETPKADIGLVKLRLKLAEKEHQAAQSRGGRTS
jgi:phage-related protein